MNKEHKQLQLGLLKCIGYIGFHETMVEMLPGEDKVLNKKVSQYLTAYAQLAEYIGFPEDLELLEGESIM